MWCSTGCCTAHFFVAKRIRSDTGIGDHAVSISYAAIELGRKIFGDLSGKKVLLIGAGEMAELAVEHLMRNRSGQIHVANRTFERGVALADHYNGTPIRFEEVPDYLGKVDIVISSTGASDFVVRKPHVKAVMRERRNRPIFFIDIAVPRDIDPDINSLNNVYVYDIDDLKGVIDENMEDRNREAVKAERIIDEAVIHFRQWYQNLGVVPTIKAFARQGRRHGQRRGPKNDPAAGTPVGGGPAGHRTNDQRLGQQNPPRSHPVFKKQWLPGRPVRIGWI